MAGQGTDVGCWRPMSYGVTGAETEGPRGLKWSPGLWARSGRPQGWAGPLNSSRTLKALAIIKYSNAIFVSRMCQGQIAYMWKIAKEIFFLTDV